MRTLSSDEAVSMFDRLVATAKHDERERLADLVGALCDQYIAAGGADNGYRQGLLTAESMIRRQSDGGDV